MTTTAEGSELIEFKGCRREIGASDCSPLSSPFVDGKTVAGRWKVLGKLGFGGCGKQRRLEASAAVAIV